MVAVGAAIHAAVYPSEASAHQHNQRGLNCQWWSVLEEVYGWTDGMVKAACEMRDLALREKVELAILMDMSGACGSTVTYQGSRFSNNKVYQQGPGVAAAALIRAGIPVISQRDEHSLQLLFDLLNGTSSAEQAMDHWEKEWYQSYFRSKEV